MTWFSRLTRRPATLPLLVALLGAGISIVAAFGVRDSVHQQAQVRFDAAAERIRTEVVRRFRQPLYGLRGAAGSYTAFGPMSRAQFAAYIASRDMAREFPGVRGFGYIQHVPRADLERFIAAERADGAPDFSVRQLEQGNHADLYVIKLVEPMARNAAARGLDVGSEAVRREAIERAVRTGQPGLTAPITLVQDGNRTPGFLLYLPIYRDGARPANEAERRAALLGVLYAPIVAAELMHDATQAASGQIAFALFHGRAAAPGDKPVFDARQPVDAGASHFEATQAVDIAGSAFTLKVSSGPAFDAAAERWAPVITLGGGLLLTAMLAYLVHLGTAGRRRAERLAQHMTVELDRLAMVARRTSDAVVITGLDRRITWVNAAFERITGYSLAEALGHSPGALLQCAATDAAAVVRLRTALDAGEPYRGELLNRAKDGREYWVELEIQPLRDARGAPSGFMAVESDVTAARHAAAQLATERQRLAQILEGTGAGTWEVDLVTGEDRVNTTYAEMLGYTLEAYQRDVGPAFMDLVHPEDREVTAARRRAHLDGHREVYELEFRMRHSSGRWVWILSHGKIVSRDAQGRPLAMSGIHLDISARKLSEQALRDTNERFALAASGAGIGVWELDPATGALVWDERMFALFGLQRAVGLQPLQIWAERLHPEDAQRVQADMAAALADERRLAAEFRIQLPGGEIRHLRAAATVVHDAGGRPQRMIGVNFDITERRAVEDALRAAKAFLDKAGRVAGVGGWRVELDTGAIEWSDETCRIHGVAPGYRPALDAAIDYYVPEARPLVQQAMADAVARCSGFDLELPLVTAQGRRIWVRTVGEVEAENGRAVRVVGAFQDVTVRRALEAELRERNEVISNVLENLPCGLSVFNARLELVASNRQYRSLLDFPDSLFEEAAPRFEDFIRFNARRGEYGDGDVETAVRSIVARAMAPTVVHRFERVRPNGVPLEIQGAPMPGGGFVTTYTDISERKRAEAEVQRSAALLRGAIDAVDEAFVLYDPQDRLVFCNDKYRQIYAGIAELIVPGARFEDLVLAGAERGNYPEAVGREAAWVAERVALHQRGDTTLVQRLDDGRTLRIIERRLPDGHIVGFRIDVTELARAVETAQDASKAKSQFLANMSHEIRTPMNAILGMLALLRKTELTPRQADYAGKTEGAARSLLGLLNDILDFSKVEAGKMTLEAQPFRFDRLLRDLAVILSANLGGKPVEVLFDIDPALPPHLVGDAMRLQQVLINLGGNAIKFTEQGNVVVSVTVAERDAGAVALDIAVQDSGIGIAPENRARIFSGFTQAEASTTRRFGGTGLGLAICQRLVAMMGGELGLQSELGRGSRFHFRVWLPVAAAPAEELPAALPGRLPGDLRALVVDDNPVARDVLERMSLSLGWRVHAVDSGAAALAALEADPGTFGAVFVDWQMPGMDGWQTCQRIRALAPAGPAPLLVMVTAHGRESLVQRSAAEQGLIDAFLVKPVTASMLHDAVVDAHSGRSAAVAPRRTVVSALRLAGLRLLVVEDNANNQQVAQELLEDEGAQVQIAANGQIAVDAVAVADPPFDAVLMDLQMPVMDGYTATRQIRQDLLNTALPIVAMTANAMRSDREACLAAGMNDHIGKPFDLDRLVQVLRRLTGRTAAPARARLASVPQTLAAQAAAAGVDLDAAVARLGGKPAVFRRMLRGFLQDLGAMPVQLAASLAAADSGEASRQMHTLKGLAATLGMKSLSAQAAEAEKVFAAGPAPDLAAAAAARATAAMRAASAALEALQGHLDAALPAAPGIDAAAPAAPDTGALRVALNTLAGLLAESDMDAVDATAQLRERHAATLGKHLAPLEDAVTGLDFGTAASVCATLLAEFEIVSDDTPRPAPNAALPAGPDARPQLLVVDDQAVNVQALYQAFAADHKVFMATSGEQALALCARNPPDLVLLDVVMPGMDGFEVCRRLKADPATQDIPVIFVTSHSDEAAETLGLDVGAVDFISKPINPRIVRARVKTHLTLKAHADQMRKWAYVDGLTGVYNRRYFDEHLAGEWRRAERTRSALGIVLLDVDFFKRYNDRYGHQAGDTCLREVAAALKDGLKRPGDLVARYGGEEFVCLLPDTDLPGTLVVARELGQRVFMKQIEHADSTAAAVVTVSLGACSAQPSAAHSAADLLHAADTQLYAAKAGGRHRTCGAGL